MNQGRLPVGPPETPQDESSPAPAAIDDRVARKVETLRHVLRLERDQNHANHAVIGGLDTFLERWIEDPDVKRVLDDDKDQSAQLRGADAGTARGVGARDD